MSNENFVRGEDRRQSLLLPDMLDKYVNEESEVRFIDAFVDSLDLEGLGFKYSDRYEITFTPVGRPPFDPRDLLKLYIWGYLNQVRSSRKLERECARNLEVIWLMKKLLPDDKTISDFRKNNVPCIKKVFREFVCFLQDIDLVEGKFASIDGTKIKAWNANHRNFTQEKIERRLKYIDERVTKYLNEIEENDKNKLASDEEDERELIKSRNQYLKEKLKKLKKRKQEAEQIQKRLNESGEREISLTDPDSRMMKNNQRKEVCYNTEMAIDSKNKLVVDYSVVNEANDANQLAPVAVSTKEALGVESLEITADSGFWDALQIKECLDNGITPYLPREEPGGARAPDPVNFGKDKFVYDSERDVYICPAGKELEFRHIDHNDHGKAMRTYRTRACKTCEFMSRCTTYNKGRFIRRWEHQEILDELESRARYNPSKIEQRKELSEHPFATIKRSFGQEYFLLKGLKKVNAEMGFTTLVYDMRRALNILGTLELVEALRIAAA